MRAAIKMNFEGEGNMPTEGKSVFSLSSLQALVIDLLGCCFNTL
jgi:hypothetical protein